MTDPASDFIRDYQALAQQSWEAWAHQFQQPAANPFAPPPTATGGNETLDRTLAGLKGYFDWLQAAAAGSAAQPEGGDWRQQWQQMFGGGQPFAQAFGGIEGAGAEGFARQWQAWLQALRHDGFADLAGTAAPTPAFGLNREQQMQQQALAAALLESLQATARYQALIQRAGAQGMQRLQDKLAEPGRQVESPKALYDLWVDASEEAYAELALSKEFGEVYAEMVNAQMRARQLQQRQTEQLCQQLGVPTRSEVSSLGERLQALRREVRASAAADHADEIMALRREVAALKRQLGAGVAATRTPPAAARKPAAKTAAKALPATRRRK